MDNTKLPKILQSIQEGAEEYGLDNRFLSSIGIRANRDAYRPKNAIKIYLPKNDLELFQVLAIYLKLKQTSIARFTRGLLKDYVKRLIMEQDPLLDQAKLLHRELREMVFKKSIEQNKD